MDEALQKSARSARRTGMALHHTVMQIYLTPELHEYLAELITRRVPVVVKRSVCETPDEERLFDALLAAARARGPNGQWIEHDGVKDALWQVEVDRRRPIVRAIDRVISGRVPNGIGLTKPELIEELLEEARRKDVEKQDLAGGNREEGRPSSEEAGPRRLSSVRSRRRRREDPSGRVPVPA